MDEVNIITPDGEAGLTYTGIAQIMDFIVNNEHYDQCQHRSVAYYYGQIT